VDITVYYTETVERTLSISEEDIREHVTENASDYAANPVPDRAEDESEEDFAERFCAWVSEHLPMYKFDAESEIESEDIDISEVSHS
jgi:hypothetical protein